MTQDHLHDKINPTEVMIIGSFVNTNTGCCRAIL